MLRRDPYAWPVITADELRDARVRAGFTSQGALADALGVSLRTVTAWEQEGGHVSPRNEARVRALLWPSPAPLSHYSNYELLSEIGRRLEQMPHQSEGWDESIGEVTGGSGITQAGDLGDKPSAVRRVVQGKATPPRTARSRKDANSNDEDTRRI